MADAPAQVAAGVHRLGNEFVNCYLVEDGDRLTLVDAALSGFRGQLDAQVRALGRRLGDIDAVILTHAHADHVGMAEGVRRDAGAPVHVHVDDAEMARTAKPHKREASMLPYLRRPATWRLFATFARNGSLKPPRIAELTTFGSGAGVLDVPGRPRVIPTPGHSPGHVAFHLEDRGVLIAGDALCTYNPLTGARGPQFAPSAFAYDNQQMLASLDALEGLAADVMVFGHGDPWRQGVAAAVGRAREVGFT